MAATQYNVLRLQEEKGPNGGALWEVIAEGIEGSGDKAAIRKIAKPSEEAATYVAVPARSFQARTGTIEMKPQLRLS